MTRALLEPIRSPPAPAPPRSDRAAAVEAWIGQELLLLHAAARRHGLTLLQLMALKLLDAQGPLAPSRLAECLGVSRPAATSSINLLEAGGWVVRAHPAGDRRALSTSLTVKGRRVLRAVAQERRRAWDDGLADLPAADREEFLRITRLLADRFRSAGALSAAGNGPGGGP
jgi:DNA-binding MarR family transcriptional regulator